MNLRQIIEIKLWMNGLYQFIITITMYDYFQKQIAKRYLWIENWSLSCQCGPLHGLQIKLFICNHFGCKLCLQSIHNHAGDCFHALGYSSLKWQCCSTGIWAPVLGQMFNLNLLLCTGFSLEHADLFICLVFTERPMNNCKIQQSYERCRRGFGMHITFLQNQSKFHPQPPHIHTHKKIVARSLPKVYTKSGLQEW